MFNKKYELWAFSTVGRQQELYLKTWFLPSVIIDKKILLCGFTALSEKIKALVEPSAGFNECSIFGTSYLRLVPWVELKEPAILNYYQGKGNG